MKMLKLTVTRQWFDMIASGEKPEEYRDPENRWIMSRLQGKDYEAVEFKNGYGPDVPRVVVRYHGWIIGKGNPKWGAQPGRSYVKILLGKIIEPATNV